MGAEEITTINALAIGCTSGVIVCPAASIGARLFVRTPGRVRPGRARRFIRRSRRPREREQPFCGGATDTICEVAMPLVSCLLTLVSTLTVLGLPAEFGCSDAIFSVTIRSIQEAPPPGCRPVPAPTSPMLPLLQEGKEESPARPAGISPPTPQRQPCGKRQRKAQRRPDARGMGLARKKRLTP